MGPVDRIAIHTVEPPPFVQRPEPVHLVFIQGDDDLAAHLVRQAVLTAEGEQHLSAVPAVFRLERSGLVVDRGVNDARVSA